MDSVDDNTDKTTTTRKKRRKGFVIKNKEAARLLRFWLETFSDASRARRDGARLLLDDLILEAGWSDDRLGVVAGSGTAMAKELGLAGNTFRDYEGLLIAAGLLERREVAPNGENLADAGWTIPPDVCTWLTDGDPLPELMVAAAVTGALATGGDWPVEVPEGGAATDLSQQQIEEALIEARAKIRNIRERLSRGLFVTPETRAPDQDLSSTTSKTEQAPPQKLNSTTSKTEQAHPRSPGQTSPKTKDKDKDKDPPYPPSGPATAVPSDDGKEGELTIEAVLDKHWPSLTSRQRDQCLAAIDGLLASGWQQDDVTWLLTYDLGTVRGVGALVWRLKDAAGRTPGDVRIAARDGERHSAGERRFRAGGAPGQPGDFGTEVGW